MHFEGEFRVPGTPSEVIRRFADVPRMASCMPGAVLEPQAEDGSWPGKMVVAFGPKKVAFKGKVTCDFDLDNCTGTLNGRGTADMRAARIGVKVSFALRPDEAASTPTTIAKIVSDAELGGVLADFARTGGVAVANVIMADFARRASAEFAKDAPGPVAGGGAAPAGAGAATVGPTTDGRTPVGRDTAEPLVADPATTEPITGAAQHRPGPTAGPAPLSAGWLLWAVIRAQFARLAKRLGLRAHDA